MLDAAVMISLGIANVTGLATASPRSRRGQAWRPSSVQALSIAWKELVGTEITARRMCHHGAYSASAFLITTGYGVSMRINDVLSAK